MYNGKKYFYKEFKISVVDSRNYFKNGTTKSLGDVDAGALVDEDLSIYLQESFPTLDWECIIDEETEDGFPHRVYVADLTIKGELQLYAEEMVNFHNF